MPVRFGAPELLIILVIVVLIFGVGRLGRMGGELGNAIRQFREGIGSRDKDEKDSKKDESMKVTDVAEDKAEEKKSA